jgi:tellurite resistance protein TehA-like permease
MKPEKQYEFVLLGIGLASASFLLPAVIGAFFDTPGFWMMMIAVLSIVIVYQVVKVFFTVKRLNPEVSIIPPGFK